MQKSESITFTGTFTPEVQRLFKEKRKALGLTCTALAKYLGVSCSLISRWENGSAMHASRENHELVKEFLDGRLDGKLLDRKADDDISTSISSIPPEAQLLAERIVSIYQLLADTPTQQAAFLKKLDETLDKYKP